MTVFSCIPCRPLDNQSQLSFHRGTPSKFCMFVPYWSLTGEPVMAESLQHKLDRVRRPRVQITYDVETGGAMEKTELPFVVGVVADLSAQPKEALRPMKERKFVPIDRDNFNEVLERATPRLAMKVQNRLTGDDTRLAGELN